MEELSKDLVSAFQNRFRPSEFLRKAVNVFHEDDLSWLVVEAEGENSENERELIEEENMTLAREIVDDLLRLWNQPVANSYNPQAVALGFLLFSKLGMRNLDLSLEDLYAKFAKKYKDIESTGEFEDFFERIQIKTCSEAVCETVGSIMTMAKGEAKYIFVQLY